MTKWLYTKEELCHTPSRLDGISARVETLYKSKTIAFIEKCGSLVKTARLTIASAIVIFHRFYLCHSFNSHDRYYVATTALFLACKVEETQKRIEDIINICHSVHDLVAEGARSGGSPLSTDSSDFLRVREKVLKTERIILHSLSFDLYFRHPYVVLVDYWGQVVVEAEGSRRDFFLQTAWCWMNDSYKTDACLTHEPKAIACACMCMASSIAGVKVTPKRNPSQGQGTPPPSATPTALLCAHMGVSVREVNEIADAIFRYLESNSSPEVSAGAILAGKVEGDEGTASSVDPVSSLSAALLL